MSPFAAKTFSDTELLNGARKSLYERSRLLTPDDTLSAIQDLKVWVGEELSFEEAASASFGRILTELAHCEYLDQLPPLLNKFERLVCAYFVRRGSVTAFHGFCTAWREAVLRRILLFAEEGLELNDPGYPPVPYALLVAGRLGRREQTLEGGNRYFLVWSEGEVDYFEQFVYRVLAILEQYGLMPHIGPAQVGRLLWRGSLADWEELCGRGLAPQVPVPLFAGEQSAHLDLLADLRHIYGDEKIGAHALRIGRSRLERSRQDAQFAALASRRVAAPAPLGLFGSIRVEKTGEHAGSFNVAQAGLEPLVAAVRLLAMQHDLQPGPTLERLRTLAELRVLEEPFAQRIEAAYHLLAGHKIGREVVLEKPYLNLAGLPAAEQRKLKEALQTVRQLQRQVRKALKSVKGER